MHCDYMLFDQSGTVQNFDIVPLCTGRQTYRQTDTLQCPRILISSRSDCPTVVKKRVWTFICKGRCKLTTYSCRVHLICVLSPTKYDCQFSADQRTRWCPNAHPVCGHEQHNPRPEDHGHLLNVPCGQTTRPFGGDDRGSNYPTFLEEIQRQQEREAVEGEIHYSINRCKVNDHDRFDDVFTVPYFID